MDCANIELRIFVIQLADDRKLECVMNFCRRKETSSKASTGFRYMDKEPLAFRPPGEVR